MKKRLLWVGDAVVSTGFAKSTHNVLDAFMANGDWEVIVCGIGHHGDPHSYPYAIFPAVGNGGDPFGVRRTKTLCETYRPDLVIVQQDPWNFPPYVKSAGNVPVIGFVAVDGKNCRGNDLNGLKHAIFWTKFGEYEAKRGGYIGESSVIPLGVDTDLYSPKLTADARYRIGLHEELRDSFIVGNVNRNQPRKRQDLVVANFCTWVKEHDVRDAMLYLHVAPTGEDAYDVAQLMKYFGLNKRLILPDVPFGSGTPEHMMPYVYSSFDVMFSCTQGEGFGLTHFEASACGVPNIIPDWSALGELYMNDEGEECAYFVPCTSIACTINGINAIGGIMDAEGAVRALAEMYAKPEVRKLFRDRGLALVSEERFVWKNIGERFVEVVDEVMSRGKIFSQVPEKAVVRG